MKFIHRLGTSMTALECEALFEAARALDVRVGWLDLDTAAAAPAELDEAADLGAFRAVGVTASRVITVKPVRGASVLKDLIREYFSGCRLVLIRRHLDAPQLQSDGDGYRVRFEDGVEKRFSAESLAKALRKSRLRALEVDPADGQSLGE